MDQRDADTRAASRRLLATSERELQRIVLDMHDGPVQDIFAALSQLQVLERALAGDAGTQQRTRQAMRLLERALGEIRNFIGAFRPPGFERRALGEIIEGLAVQHETLTNQAVELQLPDDLGDCVLPTTIAIYRILPSEEDVGVEGGHFGLRGIQDRVEMLGGTFALDSAPGRGTALTVTLPLE